MNVLPVEPKIKIIKIITTQMFKKIKMDMLFIKVVLKRLPLPCIKNNGKFHRISYEVKYRFSQIFMFIALEKSVIFLYSRYEEEGCVVLPLCVCLFVTNIYVAFFSATIRRKCYL